MGIIIGLIANIVALYLAHLWIAGFAVTGGWVSYLIAGVVLGVLNLIVKPVLKILTHPLIVISLGLFIIVINAVLLWLAAQFTGYIVVENLFALLWATLIISVVNFFTHW
jgi:putative membrane protein